MNEDNLDMVTDIESGKNRTKLKYRVCQKNDPTCFCQNIIKSELNLVIFGIQIAKTIESTLTVHIT